MSYPVFQKFPPSEDCQCWLDKVFAQYHLPKRTSRFVLTFFDDVHISVGLRNRGRISLKRDSEAVSVTSAVPLSKGTALDMSHKGRTLATVALAPAMIVAAARVGANSVMLLANKER